MNHVEKSIEQLTTFYVAGEMFGIEVLKVQEVTGAPVVVPVPLAPVFVRGLVNLRGQIATAMGLRELFEKSETRNDAKMSVVCKIEGNLVSLLVDAIGDVVDVEQTYFETAPETIPSEVRRYIKGIYKMNGALLSVLDLDIIAKTLSPLTATETASKRSE